MSKFSRIKTSVALKIKAGKLTLYKAAEKEPVSLISRNPRSKAKLD
jgi:hypothetical protein